MKVYIVGISDCEGDSIISVCATKIIAERELFKSRDKLQKRWKELMDGSGMNEDYEEMIENLNGDDYKNWNNYPCECPFLQICKVIKK